MKNEKTKKTQFFFLLCCIGERHQRIKEAVVSKVRKGWEFRLRVFFCQSLSRRVTKDWKKCELQDLKFFSPSVIIILIKVNQTIPTQTVLRIQSGSAFHFYSGWIRIRLFPLLLIRIRIFLFISIQIWIRLLSKVMRICTHWLTDSSGPHFELPWLHCEPPRLLWASMAPFMLSLW
jgi:hypothetical protein